MLRPFAFATLVCGVLDIGFAMIITILSGRRVDSMLRFVASGPFPSASEMGWAGAVLGLAVHFALMAVMAIVFLWLLKLRPELVDAPILTGIGYGVLTYFVMNWAVVPLRYDLPLPPSALSIATQLFAHIVLVGIPFALIAVRFKRHEPGNTSF